MARGTVIPTNYCHIHNKREIISDTFYRICFECGHVYNSEQELIDRYIKEAREVGGLNTEEIALAVEKKYWNEFCQECLHDF